MIARRHAVRRARRFSCLVLTSTIAHALKPSSRSSLTKLRPTSPRRAPSNFPAFAPYSSIREQIAALQAARPLQRLARASSLLLSSQNPPMRPRAHHGGGYIAPSISSSIPAPALSSLASSWCRDDESLARTSCARNPQFLSALYSLGSRTFVHTRASENTVGYTLSGMHSMQPRSTIVLRAQKAFSMNAPSHGFVQDLQICAELSSQCTCKSRFSECIAAFMQEPLGWHRAYERNFLTLRKVERCSADASQRLKGEDLKHTSFQNLKTLFSLPANLEAPDFEPRNERAEDRS